MTYLQKLKDSEKRSAKMRAMRKRGMTLKDIANVMDVSIQRVHKVVGKKEKAK